MSPKFLLYALSKAQIVQFLALPAKTKEHKAQLVGQLMQLIETDELEMERLLATFPQELAVEPAELEDLLQCSKSERRRWIKEGKIPILDYRSFRKAGRDMQYSVHDRRVILALPQDDIAQWREIHQAQIRAHRSMGAQVASEHRKTNQLIRYDFQASWERAVGEWQEEDMPGLAEVLKLAYWTVWASRWAKQNQVKALRGRKHADVYAARREAWYRRKNEAMRVLARTPYARLTFYRPEEPDKHFLHLCEEHYDMKREGYYEDIWEFFSTNAALVKQCPECVVKMEKDFYSLYHIEVTTTTFPGLRFSFHMPYPIGKIWFLSPQKLPKVVHVEQDGLFRFGRSLLESEQITHREQDVLRNFEDALDEVKALYSLNEERGILQEPPGL